MLLPSPQELLEESPCYAAMPTFLVQVEQAQLWCELAGAVNGGGGDGILGQGGENLLGQGGEEILGES